MLLLLTLLGVSRLNESLSWWSLLEESYEDWSVLNNLCSRFISTLIPIMHWCFLPCGCHMPDDEPLYGSHESLPSHFPFPFPQEYSTGPKLRSSTQTHLFFTSALQGGDCTLVFTREKKAEETCLFQMNGFSQHLHCSLDVLCLKGQQSQVYSSCSLGFCNSQCACTSVPHPLPQQP